MNGKYQIHYKSIARGGGRTGILSFSYEELINEISRRGIANSIFVRHSNGTNMDGSEMLSLWKRVERLRNQSASAN